MTVKMAKRARYMLPVAVDLGVSQVFVATRTVRRGAQVYRQPHNCAMLQNDNLTGAASDCYISPVYPSRPTAVD